MEPTLADEHEALLQFMYLSPVGLVRCTLDGEILMLNPVSAQLLLPLSRDNVLSNLHHVLQDLAPSVRTLIQDFPQDHGTVCEGLRMPVPANRQGRRQTQVLSLTVLKLDCDQFMAVVQDITESERRERLLRHHEVWLSALVGVVGDYALVGLDAAGQVESWSPSAEHLLGWRAEEVVGRACSLFYPDDGVEPDRMADRLRAADSGGWSAEDGWQLRADGHRFWGTALIAPLHDPCDAQRVSAAERGYSMIIRDASQQREAVDGLRAALTTDHLTGLANRRTFFEIGRQRVAQWQRRPDGLALILFDADHFKAVNDRHGHAAGDAVLRALGETLNACFPDAALVARIGGEEFAVLLHGDGHAAVVAAADRLRESVASQTTMVGETRIAHTVSGGVALMDAEVGSLDELLARADQALFAAKAAGRNRVHAHAMA